METGIYIRVGTENKLIEELDVPVREEWLNTLNVEALHRLVHRLCDVILVYNNETYDEEDL